MTKIFKRITSAALAASMAVSMAISASAASETKSFSARHYNFSGAPASLTYSGYAELIASSETYTGTISSMSNISYRTAKITINNNSGTIFKFDDDIPSVDYTNEGSLSWRIIGLLPSGAKVKYQIDAYTNLPNTELYVTGTISR